VHHSFEGDRFSGTNTCRYPNCLVDYLNLLSSSPLFFVHFSCNPQDTLPTALGKTLLGKALPEMLVLLGTVSEMEVDCMKLINSLQPLVGLLKSITCKVPNEFLTLDSSVLKASGDTEATIGVWTRESPHNYENNSRIHEDFVCPSATKFIIEFDSRCQTERRCVYKLNYLHTTACTQTHPFPVRAMSASNIQPTSLISYFLCLHFLSATPISPTSSISYNLLLSLTLISHIPIFYSYSTDLNPHPLHISSLLSPLLQVRLP